MNPDLILHADVLDIIFENRNKEYGAYELRTRYNKRFKNAMMIMFSIVIICCLLLYIANHFFHNQLAKIIPYEFSDVKISQANEPRQQTIKFKPAQPMRQQIATIRYVTPRIVRNEPTNPPPTTHDLGLNQIGPETKPGELAGNVVPVSLNGNGNGNSTETKTETKEETIYKTAEFMPEFPGGMEALKRFLNKNIRMPKDDIEPGTKIHVLEKFVVDEEGNISNIQTIQSGGAEFDNEVIRVLKKMPKWKPGKQNGRNVAVYFNIPVIFQSQNEN